MHRYDQIMVMYTFESGIWTAKYYLFMSCNYFILKTNITIIIIIIIIDINTGQIETAVTIHVKIFILTSAPISNHLVLLFGTQTIDYPNTVSWVAIKLFIQAWLSGISPSANRHPRGLELVRVSTMRGIKCSAYVHQWLIKYLLS